MLDVVVALLAGWLAWRGFRSGLSGVLIWIAVAALSPYLASLAAPPLGDFMAAQRPELPAFIREPAAYVLALFAIGAVIGVGSSFVLRGIRGFEQQLPFLQKADRVTGALGSAGAGLLCIGLVTVIAAPLLSEPQRNELAASYWGRSVVPVLSPFAPSPALLMDTLMARAKDRMGTELPAGQMVSEGIPSGLSPEETARITMEKLAR